MTAACRPVDPVAEALAQLDTHISGNVLEGEQLIPLKVLIEQPHLFRRDINASLTEHQWRLIRYAIRTAVDLI